MITFKQWEDHFAKALKEQLEKNKMTQKDLAEKSGITEVTISRYMHGKRVPRGTAIVKLAKALNCTTDDICMFERK